MRKGAERLLFYYMGYQVTVASFATNLNDVENIESRSRDYIGSICYKPEYPHLQNILQYYHNSLATRMHNVYEYGYNEYTYGLPDGFEVKYPINPGEVEDAIEDDLGYDVDIYGIQLKDPDHLWFAQKYAQNHWRWIEQVVEDSNGNNVTVGFCHNAPITGNAQEGYGVRLIDANLYKNNRMGAILEYKVRRLGSTSIVTEEVFFTPSNPEVFQNLKYYHVKYKPAGASSAAAEQFWAYAVGSGKYPILDDIEATPLGSPFLPIIPLREDNKNLGPKVEDGEFVRDDDGNLIVPDTDLYRTSVQLCSRADTDFNNLCREISSNPDVGDIDHAYLIFGIDIRSNTKVGKHYLYQFFNALALRNVEGIIEVKDANYRIEILFDSCTVVTKTGTISKDTVIEYSGNNMVIRRRDGDSRYREVTVTNLSHVNYVYEGHTVNTSLSDSADEEEYNFIIPLRYDLSKQDRRIMDRESLYLESYKIVFNCYEKRKLKWYESGIFKIALLVVAIVAAVYTAGQSLTAYFAGTATIESLILLAAQYVIYAELLKIGFVFLVNVLGIEAAAFIAVLAIIVAAYGGVGGDGFMTAENLLQFSSNITQGIETEIMNSMLELQKEMEEFQLYASDMNQELEDLEDELNYDSWVTPYEFIRGEPMFIPNETPDAYFNRTIHAGNIGTLSLSAAENFVDNALTLPKL